MPRTSWRPCAQPGCPELVDHGPRCNKHQIPRPTAAQRGYDHKWAINRARFLVEHPNCVDCSMPATEADHDPTRRRVLVAMGVPDPDAWHRLKPRCKSCHSRRTGRGL